MVIINMEIVNNQYLKHIDFTILENWSVQYLKWTAFSYNKNFEFVKIGDFLKRNKTQINIQDGIEYKRVTIKINNGWVFLRDTEKWKNIGTKKQFLISKWQFILSKIDARWWAFWVAWEDVDGAIITWNFWAFDVDYKKINPHFLSLMTTTHEFIHFAENASNWTTNRHYLQEDAFLSVKIPLPSLEEQNKMVQEYNRNIQKSFAAEQKSIELERKIESYLIEELWIKVKEKVDKNAFLQFIEYKDLFRWDSKIISSIKSKYEIVRVGNILECISTWTTPPTSKKEYFNKWNINFYTPVDLTNNMFLNNSERKVTELAFKDKKSRFFIKWTILFVWIWSTVWKVWIVNNEYATSNQQITWLLFHQDKVLNEYIYYYFDYFKKITTKEQTKSTIPIVNQEKILNIQVPLPPLKIQQKLVQYIWETKEQINYLQKLSKDLKEDAKVGFEGEIFR